LWLLPTSSFIRLQSLLLAVIVDTSYLCYRTLAMMALPHLQRSR
jgi:hypothetical protein